MTALDKLIPCFCTEFKGFWGVVGFHAMFTYSNWFIALKLIDNLHFWFLNCINIVYQCFCWLICVINCINIAWALPVYNYDWQLAMHPLKRGIQMLPLCRSRVMSLLKPFHLYHYFKMLRFTMPCKEIWYCFGRVYIFKLYPVWPRCCSWKLLNTNS